MALLEIQGLKTHFKTDDGWLHAVDGVDMTVDAGQTLGVVGESGSGKSTLALAALGLHPSGGVLAVLGQAWGQGSTADRTLRQGIQVVFQDPFSSLSPRLTVEDIVGEGLRVHAPALDAAAGLGLGPAAGGPDRRALGHRHHHRHRRCVLARGDRG